MDPKALFLEHLDLVDRLADAASRRGGLVGADAEDFASWVRARLMDDDYAVFRKFRGNSSLPTYLTVVVANLLKDYRIKLWGKWRASAAARRMGDLAVRLETLISRDGHSVDEAVSLLRSDGAADVPEPELRRIAAALPPRRRRVHVGEEWLDRLASKERVDGSLEAARRERVLERATSVMEQGLEHLEPGDRALLRMRYWDRMKVSEIARETGLPQRGLYTRVNRALRDLRAYLEAEGLDRDGIMDAVLGGPP